MIDPGPGPGAAGRRPVLPVRLFRSWAFSSGNAAGFLHVRRPGRDGFLLALSGLVPYLINECPGGRGRRPVKGDDGDTRVLGRAHEITGCDRGAGARGGGCGHERDAQPGGDQVPDTAGIVGLEVDPWLDPGGCRCLEQEGVHPAARGKADERLAAALGQVYLAQAGEPVALRDGQDKVLLGEPLDAVPGPQAGVLRADTLD